MNENMTREQVLEQRVYLPHFVKACAAQGIPMESQEDLANALTIAVRLRDIPPAVSPTSNLLKAAAAEFVGQRPATTDISGYMQDTAVQSALV